MDCRTARFLMDFARPSAMELPASEVTELEGHLNGCSECDTLARTDRLVDSRLGQAMRAVPVPDALRSRLLARLDVERFAWYRRRVIPALAAAAVLLVAVWGLSGRLFPLIQLDPDSILQVANEKLPGTPEKVEAWFRKEGLNVSAPGQFNYDLLIDYGIVDFKGKKVAQLSFVTLAPQGPVQARVLILSDRQFDLANVPEPDSSGGGRLKVAVWRHPDGSDDPHVAYLILYEGESLNLFLNAQAQTAAT